MIYIYHLRSACPSANHPTPKKNLQFNLDSKQHVPLFLTWVRVAALSLSLLCARSLWCDVCVASAVVAAGDWLVSSQGQAGYSSCSDGSCCLLALFAPLGQMNKSHNYNNYSIIIITGIVFVAVILIIGIVRKPAKILFHKQWCHRHLHLFLSGTKPTSSFFLCAWVNFLLW